METNEYLGELLEEIKRLTTSIEESSQSNLSVMKNVSDNTAHLKVIFKEVRELSQLLISPDKVANPEVAANLNRIHNEIGTLPQKFLAIYQMAKPIEDSSNSEKNSWRFIIAIFLSVTVGALLFGLIHLIAASPTLTDKDLKYRLLEHYRREGKVDNILNLVEDQYRTIGRDSVVKKLAIE